MCDQRNTHVIIIALGCAKAHGKRLLLGRFFLYVRHDVYLGWRFPTSRDRGSDKTSPFICIALNAGSHEPAFFCGADIPRTTP
jgi:hypothetical protein